MSATTAPHIGRMFKAARVLAGLDQSQLAVLANLHRNSLVYLETRPTLAGSPESRDRIRAALRTHGVELIADANGTPTGIATCEPIPLPYKTKAEITAEAQADAQRLALQARLRAELNLPAPAPNLIPRKSAPPPTIDEIRCMMAEFKSAEAQC